MDASGPPRFVPTLTEVVQGDPDDASLGTPAPSLADAPAGAGAALAAAPSLVAWQADLAPLLLQALAGALQACPVPAGGEPDQVRQSLRAALAQASEVLLPRN